MQTIAAGQELSVTILNDWAPLTLSDTATPATNFSVTAFTVYWIAGVSSFFITLGYSGSTLTGSSSGAITATTCVTLPFAPQARMILPFQSNTTAAGTLYIDTGGVCHLATLAPTATIASGASIIFSGIILTG